MAWASFLRNLFSFSANEVSNPIVPQPPESIVGRLNEVVSLGSNAYGLDLVNKILKPEEDGTPPTESVLIERIQSEISFCGRQEKIMLSYARQGADWASWSADAYSDFRNFLQYLLDGNQQHCTHSSVGQRLKAEMR